VVAADTANTRGLEGFMEGKRERERELLFEEVREWIGSMEYVCHSPEVMELIRRLEKEHHAYPQVLVNVEEN
jgi:hypothetical protein